MDTIDTHPNSVYAISAVAMPAAQPEHVSLIRTIDGKPWRIEQLSPKAAIALAEDLQRAAAHCHHLGA